MEIVTLEVSQWRSSTRNITLEIVTLEVSQWRSSH